MTALTKYQRLECFGLWRADAEGQRRDVAVAFGEASLVMTDPLSGTPLAHWSLPAVTRQNPGVLPAVYAPDGDSAETLELEDPDMIDALETVQRVLARGRKGFGRVRIAVLSGSLLMLLIVGVFWLPDALVRHTATVVPLAKRTEIGLAILADVQAAGLGTPCRAPLGLRALARLQERIGAPANVRIMVMQGNAVPPARLFPGRQIVLGEAMFAAHDTPEVPAGHILAEVLRNSASDPLVPVLEYIGPLATLRLLATGDLRSSDLRGYGAQHFAAPVAQPDTTALLAMFAAADVRSSPYAFAVDPTGETTLRLIEADPFRTTPPQRPVLSDGDWISLQGICTD